MGGTGEQVKVRVMDLSACSLSACGHAQADAQAGLKAFFEPASVAVIGASTDPTKLGHAVLRNLVEACTEPSRRAPEPGRSSCYIQRGKVYPINPHAEEILGYRAYPSVLDELTQNQVGACAWTRVASGGM